VQIPVLVREARHVTFLFDFAISAPCQELARVSDFSLDNDDKVQASPAFSAESKVFVNL